MSRVKRGVMTKKRHKRVLKQTKGYWGQRSNVFTRAKETLIRSLEYAYIGRKQRKRSFRALFISRLNAACRVEGMSYSVFIHGLKKLNCELNRKMLSQLAILEPEAFVALAARVRTVIAA